MFSIISPIKALIQYRHLLWELAIKDIKVRYRSPILGFFWSILAPLITVLIFKFIFSTILKARVENYPFFIYLMTAIFPWMYFSTSIDSSVECIFNNRELIKNTYFPRQIIPVSVVLANLINFLPALIVMILFLLLFKMKFTIFIFLVPAVIFLQTIFTIGCALIVSSLQVKIRDIKYIVQLLLMIWFYLSPVFYSLTMVANVSQIFLKLYILNPFVGFFCLYRIAFLKEYTDTLPMGIDIVSLSIWTTVVCIVVFLIGLLVFKKYEPRFSDLI